MSYEKKLMQMKNVVKKNPINDSPKKEVATYALPFYTEDWEKAGLKLLKNEHGYLFVKESFYPDAHIHGNIALSKLPAAISFMQEHYPDHPLTIPSGSSYSFYDTETTGLKGTGVLIFLNGLLKKVKNGYMLTQHVLADPGQEGAFLYASAFWEKEQTVITYNGKSFDIPQLVTRWTMNRNILPKLKENHQIDLMHSSKRVWKNELERFKLKQIEEQKLGFIRKDDVPGHLAPIIYFDAVKSGNPSNLMKVLKHNEWDILSLVTLYIQTVDILKEHMVVETSVTYTNIGKWFQDLKTTDASLNWFHFVVDNFPKDEVGMAYMYVGYHLKRKKTFTESIEAFKQALNDVDGKYHVEILIELAKIYEHQLKDYQSALEMTVKSEESLGFSREEISTQKYTRLKLDLQKRKQRLFRKINISWETAQANKKRVEKP